MKFLLDVLDRHHDDVARAGAAVPTHCSFVLLTPQFRTSRSAVFLIVDQKSGKPALVAKVARVDDLGGYMEREAANLSRMAACRQTDGALVPQLIAYDTSERELVLIQTAITGRLMRPTAVRENPENCVRVASNWLERLWRETAHRPADARQQLHRLIETPLQCLCPMLDEEGHQLLMRTRELAATLDPESLSFVFEHGDLSSPNLFLLRDGIGVIDWELGEPTSLPYLDLFFFLTYVAGARESARSPDAIVKAAASAFTGAQPSMTRYLERFAEWSPGIDGLRALFALCWLRNLGSLAARAYYAGGLTSNLDARTWLRQEPSFHLWRFAVNQAAELNFS